MADTVSVALLVVLERLDPAERLAFVLHDLFGLAFAEIAPIVERSVPATRQLASRARRTLRGAEPDAVQATPAERRRVIDAFLAASRDGNFEALIEVLDPEVVLRVDPGRPIVPFERHGARDVAELVIEQGQVRAPFARPAIVNGAPGVVVARGDEVIAVAAFTIAGGRITGLNVIADPGKLARVRV
jgi:RNA polymerase sigma-70 factor (ECF subfamily)